MVMKLRKRALLLIVFSVIAMVLVAGCGEYETVAVSEDGVNHIIEEVTPGLMKVKMIKVRRVRAPSYDYWGHVDAFDEGLRELAQDYDINFSGIVPINYTFGDDSFTRELLVPVFPKDR